MITGAIAVAVIILVQGAGVSQSVPNPNGTRSSASRNFSAEGMANVAAGFFRGIPIGGSLSTTALNVSSGTRTRWASIFAGLLVALLVILLPGLVSQVAMPALGALLILVGASAVKPSDAQAIWNTGWPARMASASTFVATLFLQIQVAVGIGVVLSAILYLNESSAEISVVQMVERPDGRIEERKTPRRLPSNQVTMLDVYGALSYAGARTLERLLPSPRDAQRPVVVLRLRGLTTVGATLTDVLATYAEQLHAMHGRLYLAGISGEARDQMAHSDTLGHSGAARIYEATPIVGESTRQAHNDARAWLASQRDGSASEEASPAQNATS